MRQISSIPWDFIAIALVLGIVVPWRGAMRVKSLLARADLPPRERLAIYGSTILFQWVLSGFTVWRCVVHGWHAADLALAVPYPRTTIEIGLALASVLGFIQLAAFHQLSKMPAEGRGRLGAIAEKLMPRTLIEMVAFLALVCTVSLCEEFLYRGFVFSLFQRIFAGSIMAAVVGSSAIFGFGHYYQGRRGILNTSFLGLLFAMTRFWTHSLAPAVLGHFVVDLIAGLGGARWAASRARTVQPPSQTDGASPGNAS
jgi:uncharacterized protein